MATNLGDLIGRIMTEEASERALGDESVRAFGDVAGDASTGDRTVGCGDQTCPTGDVETLLIDLTIFSFGRGFLGTFHSLARCRWNVANEQDNVPRGR